MKRIGLLLLLNGFLSVFCFGQESDSLIYINPEIQPTFSYDTCTSLKSSMKEYFMDMYKMPKILLDNGYVGNIIVEFVIEKDSSLRNIRLVQGIDRPLDESVIETIKAMPNWNPGIEEGKVVRTKMALTISIHWLYGRVNNENK